MARQEHQDAGTVTEFKVYVALGDSTTEGLFDPDEWGGNRGWADRLAEHIARHNPGLLYANLAVRGRLTRHIREEQLEPALAMRPDLVSVVAGMNDILRPSVDITSVAADIDAMFSACRAAGAKVITSTFGDPVPINPWARVLRRRMHSLNAAVRASANRHGAVLVDFASELAVSDPRFWCEDRLHANTEGHIRIAAAMAETVAAIERAIQVFRDLGATTADVRLPTRQEYNDVKMVIAKAEILAIHEKELRERPGDFCADFLGRNLPGCLFSATDYVRAQRERRRMIDDLKPVFDKCDVLLTASGTPAGRLDALVGRSSAQRWESSNIYNPFNVTGLPALMVCNGYSEQGLPLSMQIAGWPFDEATVFRAGHAYERATQWRSRRPLLRAGVKVEPLEAPVESTSGVTVDESVRQLVAQAVQHAGFKLNAQQMQTLCALAPPALASVDRVRRSRPREDEPAAVFGYGDEW